MVQPHIKQKIKDQYTTFAENVSAQDVQTFIESADCAFSRRHYGEPALSGVPPTALYLASGCGNPFSFTDIPYNCTVVDLGCGGGIDVILAARRAEQGRVLGIDMVPGMIKRAQQAVAESGLQQNIFFRVADIEDIHNLPRNFADVVLANCVITLCPDKHAAYKNIFRILRPGGVLIVSEPVLSEEIDPQLRERIEADQSYCLSGALTEEEHLLILKKFTFEVLEIDFFALSEADIETIARYPGRDSILHISREDLFSLQGKTAGMTLMAKRQPLN